VFVGIVRLVLQIPESRSLKDRRQVVRSLKDRLKAKLPVAVAEVGDVELYQRADVGVTTVSREAAQCEQVLEQAVSMAANLGDAWLVESATRVLPFQHLDALGEKAARGT
jgi:uncharacterized protein